MKKYIRLLAMFVTVCLTLAFAPAGLASGRTVEDINEEIRQAEIRQAALAEENKKREAEIRETQGDVNQLERLKNLVEQQIAGVQSRINELNGIIDLQWEAINSKQAQIKGLEEDIADTEAEVLLREDKISRLEAENEENLEKFGQLIRNNYMTGTYGHLDVLMQSGDFYDMVVRTDVLRKAAERNNDFMNDLLDAIEQQEIEIKALEEVKERLDQSRIRCEQEKAQLEIELAELYERMDDLDSEMAAEQSKLWDYASEIKDLQDSIDSMYRRYSATNAEIAALEELTTELIRQKQNLQGHRYADDGFIWPLDSRFQLITCGFGWDAWRNGPHNAIDIGNAGINGANIYAIQSGTVLRAVESNSVSGYGSNVIIDHGGGVTSLYAHMIYGSVTVSEGQTVQVGDVIGKVGSTGFSTGAHLHFEVLENGVRVNPLNYEYTFYY